MTKPTPQIKAICFIDPSSRGGLSCARANESYWVS